MYQRLLVRGLPNTPAFSSTDNNHTGLHINLYGRKAVDTVRVITSYVGTTKCFSS